MDKFEKEIAEDIMAIETLLPNIRKSRQMLKNRGYLRAYRKGRKARKRCKTYGMNSALTDSLYQDEVTAIRDMTKTIIKLQDRLSELKYKRRYIKKRAHVKNLKKPVD